MKRRNGLKNILFMVALAVGGAIFRKPIMEVVAKIPVLGDMVAKIDSSTNG